MHHTSVAGKDGKCGGKIHSKKRLNISVEYKKKYLQNIDMYLFKMRLRVSNDTKENLSCC